MHVNERGGGGGINSIDLSFTLSGERYVDIHYVDIHYVDMPYVS